MRYTIDERLKTIELLDACTIQDLIGILGRLFPDLDYTEWTVRPYLAYDYSQILRQTGGMPIPAGPYIGSPYIDPHQNPTWVVPGSTITCENNQETYTVNELMEQTIPDTHYKRRQVGYEEEK